MQHDSSAAASRIQEVSFKRASFSCLGGLDKISTLPIPAPTSVFLVVLTWLPVRWSLASRVRCQVSGAGLVEKNISAAFCTSIWMHALLCVWLGGLSCRSPTVVEVSFFGTLCRACA